MLGVSFSGCLTLKLPATHRYPGYLLQRFHRPRFPRLAVLLELPDHQVREPLGGMYPVSSPVVSPGHDFMSLSTSCISFLQSVRNRSLPNKSPSSDSTAVFLGVLYWHVFNILNSK